MYKVIKYFVDLQDNNYKYNINDTYPRKGMSVLPSRIKELSGSKNKQGVPLIKEVEDAKTEKKLKPTEKADKE